MKTVIISLGVSAVDDLKKYIPSETEEIATDDTRFRKCIEKYAMENGIKLTVFLSEDITMKAENVYDELISYGDFILVFRDDRTSGRRYIITECERQSKFLKIIEVKKKKN